MNKTVAFCAMHRKSATIHGNSNHFNFLRADRAGRFHVGVVSEDLIPMPSRMTSQHVYEVRPRSDKRGVDLIFDALTRSGSRPFDQFYCGNWLSPLAELTGCGRSVPILAKR